MASELRHHIDEILRGAFVTFALRIIGALLNFGFFILLARFLDADGAGVFFLTLSIIALAVVVGTLGIPIAALRFASASISIGDMQAIAGLHRLSRRNIALASLSLSLILLIIAPWLGDYVFHEPAFSPTLRWMALVLLPASMVMYYAELFRAVQHIAASNITQTVGMHALNVVLLLIGYYFLTLSETLVGAFYTLAGVLLCLSASLYWRHLKKQASIPEYGSFDHGLLMRISIPLLWSQALTQALYWIDTLVIGAFHDAEAVGLYNAAMRSVMLIIVLEAALNSLASPKFSALHHVGELVVLGKVVRRTSALLLVSGGLFTLGFLIAADWILLIFGEEFVRAAPALRILAIGMFLSVATSAASQVLMMTGHERLHRRNMMIAVIVSLILNLLLVPSYGIVGAAIGGACGFALRNVLAAFTVQRKMGIRMLP